MKNYPKTNADNGFSENKKRTQTIIYAGLLWPHLATFYLTSAKIYKPTMSKKKLFSYFKLLSLIFLANPINAQCPTPVIVASSNTICAGNSSTLTLFTGLGASNAVNFDGVDDYVETNSNITNLNNGDFTIEAWVKTTGTSRGLVVCANNNNAWEAGEKAFYINSGGQPTFVGYGNAYINSLGSASINNNVWRHVAVVWDWTSGTSGIGKMYVDGVDVTGSVNYVTNNPNLGTFKLGRANFFSGEAPNFLNGSMDEVRIWNVARTQPQIAANRSLTIPGNSAGLVAYYQFNESS